MIGTEWQIESVEKVSDGDTVRVIRSRVIQLGDDWYRIQDTDEFGNRRSIPIRLVWVDTPERGDHPGWETAREDLIGWISVHKPLSVICYESAGWDRMLGDLIGADGCSASQWLMTERGWPPYLKG